MDIDIEAIFTPQTATELASSIVTHAEKESLANSDLSIEQTLTLAFSAREGTFKATRTSRQADTGFTQHQVVVSQRSQMIFRAHHQVYRAQWRFSGNAVITLATVQSSRQFAGQSRGGYGVKAMVLA